MEEGRQFFSKFFAVGGMLKMIYTLLHNQQDRFKTCFQKKEFVTAQSHFCDQGLIL